MYCLESAVILLEPLRSGSYFNGFYKAVTKPLTLPVDSHRATARVTPASVSAAGSSESDDFRNRDPRALAWFKFRAHHLS
eukprot:2740077-Rhodomonas_salina.1